MLRVGLSRPDPHLPDRPNRPFSTQFQLESTLLMVGYGFPRPRPDAGGSSGGFLLQNPSHLTRSLSYTNPANSDKIKLRFKEIRPNPSNFQRKKCKIQRENLESSEYFKNLVRFSNSGKVFFFLSLSLSLQISMLSLFHRSTQPDQCSPSLETESTDFSDGLSLGSSTIHPTPAGRVWVGSKTDSARLVDSPSYESGRVDLQKMGQVTSQLIFVSSQKIQFQVRLGQQILTRFAMSIINTQSQQLAVITKEVQIS